MEKGTTDAEHKRFTMLLGNEKDRVKWEQIVAFVKQNYEVLDDLKQINKHKDNLLRENESLRLQQWNDRNPVGPLIRRPLSDPFARRAHADQLSCVIAQVTSLQ